MPDNPYIVLQTERFECHHGPDRNKAKKVKAQNAQVHFIGIYIVLNDILEDVYKLLLT